MKKVIYFLSLFSFVAVGALLSATPANAAPEINNIIDGYSDPKGFDDDYYVQSGIFNVSEFTTRELADYIGQNDLLLNGYTVIYNDGMSGSDPACSPEQRQSIATSLRTGNFVSYTTDYYMSGSGVRELTGVSFTTFRNSDTIGDLIFNSTLHAFNNRGVYIGGFLSGAPNEYENVTIYQSGTNLYVFCQYNNNDRITGSVWQNSAVSGRLFNIGILYDSWYPDDPQYYSGYYLNYMPVGTTVIYPEDYTGDGIPAFPPISEGGGDPDPIETAPNWYISNIIDNKGKFHDQNFNTFDGNPFLCEGDLAPVLYWEIFRILPDDTEIMITSGYQSATAEINYDFGPADTDRDYLILGWYDCGDGTPFPNQGRAYFTINRGGMLVKDLFEACVDENFPFIHPEGCMANMYTTINLLYFGEVSFPNWTFNPACQNLSTMDDWLGLPNGYQVCPQIPNSVRSIVTPFVAFMLGLITLKFLNRRSGEWNG